MNISRPIRIIFGLIRGRNLIPLIRCVWYALRNGNKFKVGYVKAPLKFSYMHVRWGRRLTLQKNCRIEAVTKYVGVKYDPVIILGDYVSFQQNAHVTCAERIEIGDNTAIASNVTITDIDHPYCDIDIPIEQQPLDVTPVFIGRDCKIYNNAVVLKGTVIGNHCVIGANSVVKGIFPDNSIIVGCPARIVKRYNSMSNRWEPTHYDGTFK